MRKLLLSILLLGVLCKPMFSKEKVRERFFEFVYVATISDLPKDTKEVNLWIPYPKDKPFQKVYDIKIKSPFPYKINYGEKYGNAILYVKVINPTISDFTVEAHYKIKRKEHKNIYYDTKNLKKYLVENNLVIINDKIKKISQKITSDKKDDFKKARAIYDYVFEHMKYDKSGKGWGRGDSKYACDVGKGNCTDFHSLFIAIARASNIPARFFIGFSIPKNKEKGKIYGYHCWAEFYIKDRGWFPVDISEAWKDRRKRDYYFGTCCENRIGFTMGRDIKLTPHQNNEPLNYFIYPYCEVNGKPFYNIDKEFVFKDLK